MLTWLCMVQSAANFTCWIRIQAQDKKALFPWYEIAQVIGAGSASLGPYNEGTTILRPPNGWGANFSLAPGLFKWGKYILIILDFWRRGHTDGSSSKFFDFTRVWSESAQNILVFKLVWVTRCKFCTAHSASQLHVQTQLDAMDVIQNMLIKRRKWSEYHDFGAYTKVKTSATNLHHDS